MDQTESLERTSSLRRSVFSEHLDQLDKFILGETYAWVTLSKPIIPTYINNLIVSDTVFLPTYATYASPSQNAKAIEFYSRLFKVVRIDGADIMIRAQGAVHCLTNTVH
ncbi:MAG: agmatine deiminase family protein [Bdellovibrionales bacterium]|nr:agmatine deiminase family protein [Bdellovibrionales bacterium]